MTSTPPASRPRRRGFWPLVLLLALAGLALGRLAPDLLARATTARWVQRLEDPAQRTRAYLELLERQERAVGPLLSAAQDPAFGARADAVELLGRIGERRALPALLALDDPALAHDRLVALGRLRGPQALEELLAVLRRGGDSPLLFPALEALADWPDAGEDALPDAVYGEVVQPCLAHEQRGLRRAAARFAGKHRQAEAQPALIALLEDPAPEVRQQAAWALVQLGTPEGVAAVESALLSGAVAPDE